MRVPSLDNGNTDSLKFSACHKASHHLAVHTQASRSDIGAGCLRFSYSAALRLYDFTAAFCYFSGERSCHRYRMEVVTHTEL